MLKCNVCNLHFEDVTAQRIIHDRNTPPIEALRLVNSLVCEDCAAYQAFFLTALGEDALDGVEPWKPGENRI